VIEFPNRKELRARILWAKRDRAKEGEGTRLVSKDI
jgi:hypothetical protein